MNKFSIITVTYNAEKVIERTLKSVAEQTYPHIEHIIVDGASTDGTMDLVHRAAHLPVAVSEYDSGIYDAMNKGLRMATGDYVWFINAGDTLYDNTTAQQAHNQISQLPALPDIFYGNALVINEINNTAALRRLQPPQTLTWKSFKSGMLVCHQSFVVKRSIAVQYNLHYRYSADVDWCIRCMKKTTSIYNTHLILSRFLEGGVSDVHRRQSLRERYQIMCRYYGTLATQLRHLWFALRFLRQKIRKIK